MCPRCGQDAPLLYRSLIPTCTACGAPRLPLTARSINVAGKPSDALGSVARVFGYLTLGLGFSFALMVGGLLAALLPTATAAWVVGASIALASTVVATLLLRGGGALQKSGRAATLETNRSAIFALARVRGGWLRPSDVAASAGVSLALADELLTTLAKTEPDSVRLEVDDHGSLLFGFAGMFPPAPLRTRVGVQPGTRSGEFEDGEAGEERLVAGSARSRTH